VHTLNTVLPQLTLIERRQAVDTLVDRVLANTGEDKTTSLLNAIGIQKKPMFSQR
jgi:hypothetical protein